MNRGVWVGALVLCLGGAGAELCAQENIWRPILRPTARGALPRSAWSGPTATLGRPVPILRAASAESDGGDTTGGVYPAVHAGPAQRTIASFSSGPGEVIAAAGSRPAEEPESGDLFAQDRARPALPAGAPSLGPAPFLPPPVRLGEVVPAGNWTETYPVAGPPPVLPVDGPTLPGPVAPVAKCYLTGEYLLWWIKPDRIPPLVTTGSVADGANAGVLGLPGTAELFGGSVDGGPLSGARFMAGYWLDDCTGKALEFGGFFLGPRSDHFFASSALFPVLARPFFNLNQNVNAVEQVAFPGRSTGNINVVAPSDLWGLEANLQCKLCCGNTCGCDWRTNALVGVRYLNLHESISITEMVQGEAGAPPPFTNAMSSGIDLFSTRNQFYGGQVGLQSCWQSGRWSLDLKGKLALGVTEQELDINGSQRITNPSGPVSSLPGNLLALNSNIGHFSQNRFSVVPELGVNLGYHLLPNLRCFVGYNLLYWSSVLRPGGQIDTSIDITRIPNFQAPPGTQPVPGLHPAPLLKTTDFWAQGLVFGIEFVF
jgi:hypothetical protein